MGSADNTLPKPSLTSSRLPLDLPLGMQIGRYQLVRQLGSGAMGIIFEARDVELDRIIALKLPRQVPDDMETTRAHLIREAQLMARLSHVNVARIFEVSPTGEHPFLAMELVRGGTLRELVGTDRPWRQQLRALIAAGHGLAATHEAGVIHRDFKPDNVLVQADGEVRLTDFGLALVADDGPSLPRDLGPLQRHTSKIAGTGAYMAPESFDGIVGAAADQFAFAVTAFEVLEGRRPFGEEATLDAHLRRLREGRRLPWLRQDLPPWLRAVIDRGLALIASDRWPSLSAMCAALEQSLAGSRRRCTSRRLTS